MSSDVLAGNVWNTPETATDAAVSASFRTRVLSLLSCTPHGSIKRITQELHNPHRKHNSFISLHTPIDIRAITILVFFWKWPLASKFKSSVIWNNCSFISSPF